MNALLTNIYASLKQQIKEYVFKPVLNPILPLDSLRREYIKQLYFKLRGRQNRFEITRYFLQQKLNHAKYMCFSMFPGTIYYNNKKKILNLKNSHNGERCFFVGLGPSLRIEDLDCLTSEQTFSVNNVFALFRQTTWRPTYYLNQETIVLNSDWISDEFKAKYQKCDLNTAFFPFNRHRSDVVHAGKNVILLPIVNDWCMYFRGKRKMEHFSRNICKEVNAAFLSMYSLLQIAVYMGFTSIYLIGCDAKYEIGRTHCYQEDNHDKILYKSNQELNYNTSGIHMGFSAMKSMAEKHGIQVYNATRGGYLELFPRVDFDSLFTVK